MIRYEVGNDLPLDQVLALYRTLGWAPHKHPERVERALERSTRVVSAWDGDRLIGWARMVSDGEFCCFVHEILFYPEYQRQGHGTELMKRLLVGYEHVQNTVLLADPGNEPFYERLGFRVVNRERMPFQAMYRFGVL